MCLAYANDIVLKKPTRPKRGFLESRGGRNEFRPKSKHRKGEIHINREERRAPLVIGGTNFKRSKNLNTWAHWLLWTTLWPKK